MPVMPSISMVGNLIANWSFGDILENPVIIKGYRRIIYSVGRGDITMGLKECYAKKQYNAEASAKLLDLVHQSALTTEKFRDWKALDGRFYVELLQDCLRQGADPNTLDSKGETVLSVLQHQEYADERMRDFLAAWQLTPSIDTLLDAGACPFSTRIDFWGVQWWYRGGLKTALHLRGRLDSEEWNRADELVRINTWAFPNLFLKHIAPMIYIMIGDKIGSTNNHQLPPQQYTEWKLRTQQYREYLEKGPKWMTERGERIPRLVPTGDKPAGAHQAWIMNYRHFYDRDVEKIHFWTWLRFLEYQNEFDDLFLFCSKSSASACRARFGKLFFDHEFFLQSRQQNDEIIVHAIRRTIDWDIIKYRVILDAFDGNIEVTAQFLADCFHEENILSDVIKAENLYHILSPMDARAKMVILMIKKITTTRAKNIIDRKNNYIKGTEKLTIEEQKAIKSEVNKDFGWWVVDNVHMGDGDTFLHKAVRENNAAFSEFLWSHGANLLKPNDKNERPIDYKKEYVMNCIWTPRARVRGLAHAFKRVNFGEPAIENRILDYARGPKSLLSRQRIQQVVADQSDDESCNVFPFNLNCAIS